MTDPATVGRIAQILNDIGRFSDAAARIVARGKAAYDTDEMLRLAAEALLHKIGEAVARLPAEFVDAHPEVSWRAMKATRNVVAHNYEQVDYDILWNAFVNRLPHEARRMRAIAAELGSGEGG